MCRVAYDDKAQTPMDAVTTSRMDRADPCLKLPLLACQPLCLLLCLCAQVTTQTTTSISISTNGANVIPETLA